MNGNPLLASTFQSEADVKFRRQRHQTWWAIGVAIGVGVLSLILNASLLYFISLDSRARNMTVNKAAAVETARWQALFALQRDNAAQLATVKREQSRINEVLASLTNRPPVVANKARAVSPTKGIHDTDSLDLLTPLLVKLATDADWNSAYERYLRICPNGANVETTQTRLGPVSRTREAILSVLPHVGGDYWSMGYIMVPIGPDGVNAKGVQSSSHLIGVRGSLP